MGSPANTCLGDPWERFQQRARITRPFSEGRQEVTQAQYESVTGANPIFFTGKNLSVEHVTWQDAHRFCALLSSLLAEQKDGWRYRLRTEAEWEYACRTGTMIAYNTDDRLTAKEARFCEEKQGIAHPTAPVGSYPANAWGLFEMHGNVWEWTADWFSADYFRRSLVDEPKGLLEGTHPTLRGDSASVLASECFSAVGCGESQNRPETQSVQRTRSSATSDCGWSVTPRITNRLRRAINK